MTEVGWHRLQELFQHALALAPDKREAFLADLAPPEMRARVASMLDEASSDSFLRDLVGHVHSGVDDTISADEAFAVLARLAAASNRYDLTRLIGVGGMGVVGEAFDRVRRCRVALKALVRLHPSAISQFKLEFRTLTDISHPNLAALYELIGEADQWLLSMEYVEGSDFLTHVRPPGSTSPDATRLRAALPQLVSAVRHLHDHGILHRDLKPRNVLVTDEGRVVVLDFGLAIDLADVERQPWKPRGFAGTLAYMAPEQASGHPLAPSSDYYAVGVMVYEALTGRRPFDGPVTQLLHDKQSMDPPPPSDVAGSVPADLEHLCLNWLSRRPAERLAGGPAMERLGQRVIGARGLSRCLLTSSVVGREDELGVLRAALHDSGFARPVVVRIHGPSGIGKTVLLDAFGSALAGDSQVVWLAGRCHELELAPYKAFDAVVEALAHHADGIVGDTVGILDPTEAAALARVFPVWRGKRTGHSGEGLLERVDDLRARHLAFGALRRLIGIVAAGRRVVMCVDDLHWADQDSAMLLRELLRPPDAPAMLLLVAYRDEGVQTGPCAELLASPDCADWMVVHELPLGPLSPAALVELVAQVAPSSMPEGVVDRIASECGGNPYFLTELLTAGNAASEEAPSLDEALWRRVEAQSSAARRLLALVAVAGQPLGEGEVFDASGLTPPDPSLLGVLRSARLVRRALGAASALECWHDRVRTAVVSRLTPDDLRVHHRELARVLEATGHVEPERLARHLEGAGITGSARRYFGLAAHAAGEALAFDRAADLYRKAFTLEPVADERRVLLVGLATALANAGRGPEAARTYDAAADTFGPASTLPVSERSRLYACQRRAAYWYTNSGHSRDGRRVFETILRRVGIRLASSPWRQVMGLVWAEIRLRWRGLSFRERTAKDTPLDVLDRIDVIKDVGGGLNTADILAGAYLNARALYLALDAGEPNRIAYLLIIHMTTSAILGPWARTRHDLYRRHAKALEPRVEDPVVCAAFRWGEGLSCFFAGRFEAAARFLEDGAHRLRHDCRGETREAAQAEVCMHAARLHTGRVRDVHEGAGASLDYALERGDLFLAAAASVYRAEAALFVDSPAAAAHALDRAEEYWTEPGYHTIHAQTALARARIALYRDDASGARRHLAAEWPRLRDHFYLMSEHFWQWCYFTRASVCLAVAEQEGGAGGRRAVRAAERDARRLQRDTLSWSRPLASLIFAGCAAHRRDQAGVRRWLSLAARAETEMGLISAIARYRLGHAGDDDASRALVAEAEATIAALGVRDPRRAAAVFSPGLDRA